MVPASDDCPPPSGNRGVSSVSISRMTVPSAVPVEEASQAGASVAALRVFAALPPFACAAAAVRGGDETSREMTVVLSERRSGSTARNRGREHAGTTRDERGGETRTLACEQADKFAFWQGADGGQEAEVVGGRLRGIVQRRGSDGGRHCPAARRVLEMSFFFRCYRESVGRSASVEGRPAS